MARDSIGLIVSEKFSDIEAMVKDMFDKSLKEQDLIIIL